MDVRCERCKTEYEFDDSRVADAGVTVKCTSCGHVFRVKRKAIAPNPAAALHVNSHGPDTSPIHSFAAHSASESGERREWKVRQANGSVLTFRQLTTLQKWIVERKVMREDEISLTGETWKRLGDIAELGIFFEVVEEAQKARQLRLTQPHDEDDQDTPADAPGRTRLLFSPAVKHQNLRHGGPWLLLALAVAALAVAGLYGYSTYVRAKPAPAIVTSPAPRESPPAPIAPEAKDPAAAGTLERQAPPASKTPEVEPGVAAPAMAENADASTQVTAPSRPARAERSSRAPAKDFDWYMAQGDKLRDRQRYKSALNAYRLAAELDPSRAEPPAGRGYSLLDLGQRQQAESAFREALRLNPRYAVAVMGLAETYRQLGKNAQAIEQYERYLEILPDGSEAPLARAAIERLKE